MIEKNFNPIVNNCSLFKDLDFLNMNLSYTVRNYIDGENIVDKFWQNEYLGILIEGQLYVKKFFSNTKEFIIKSLFPSDFFGICNLFSNYDFPYSLISQGISSILFIPKYELCNLLKTNPIFFDNYMKTINEKMLYLNKKIEFLNIPSVQNKIIQYLISSCKNYKKDTVYIPFKRNELALFLGISRASLYRELEKLEKSNLIKISPRSIRLLNKKKLEKFLYPEN